MSAAVITGAFVVAAVGAFWALLDRHADARAHPLSVGVLVGLRRLPPPALPDGRPARQARRRVPAAGRSPRWRASSRAAPRAELAIIGQPDVANRTLENPIVVPGALSFLAYGSFGATVHGPRRLPARPVARQRRAPLLRVPHHGRARDAAHRADARRARPPRARPAPRVARDALDPDARRAPFPYIATTAGWMTAELGRQPWIVYGLHADRRGHLADRERGQRRLLDARLHGALPRARRALPLPRRPRRSRAGPATPRTRGAATARVGGATHGDRLVRDHRARC